MRKFLLYTFLLIFISAFSSCMDEDELGYDNRNTTIFSVFECDDTFNERSVATSYISIGAEVSIWEVISENEKSSYILIDILTTGIDGKAVYRHNKESFYYSVEKITEDSIRQRNLLTPLSTPTSLANSFEVAGIFSSAKDIENFHHYNLPHLSEEYIPKVGSVKFKDVNGDGTIDIDDSVSKVFLHNPNREETVYIVTDSAN